MKQSICKFWKNPVAMDKIFCMLWDTTLFQINWEMDKIMQVPLLNKIAYTKILPAKYPTNKLSRAILSREKVMLLSQT